MRHFTSPPTTTGDTKRAAEPPGRAARFDERGIALQTIIITVVMLAIAGAVAAVLFSRAGEETERLQGSGNTQVYAITSELLCTTGGHDWGQANTTAEQAVELNAARPAETWITGAAPAAYCKPN